MATSTSNPEAGNPPATTTVSPEADVSAVQPVTYEDGVPRLPDGRVELLPTSADSFNDGVEYAVPATDEEIPTTKKALDAGGYVVRYKGVLTALLDGRRIITREDWERGGIKNQDDVAFVPGNGFTVPTSEFNAQALAYCRDVDPGLVIEPA